MKNKVIANLFLAIVLAGLVSFSGNSQSGKRMITLEDLFVNYTFFPDFPQAMIPMPDGKSYCVQEEYFDLVAYDYATGLSRKKILDGNVLKEAGIKGYQGFTFSPDGSRILLVTNRQPIYRHSFTAEYMVYHVPSATVVPLSGNGPQQVATFSPDGNKVAFVRQNNLFIKDLLRDEEIQITSDGKINQIINGIPDWVYEEEFEYSRAFEWSPDSRKVAWCRFDESNVRTFAMSMFKGLRPELKEYATYPGVREWKYPKAGEDNSVVTVHVYDLETHQTVRQDVGEETDQYIPRIRWTADPEYLCIFRLNRLQNKLELLRADYKTGKSEVFYTEENKYYLDEKLFDSFTFLKNGKEMVFMSERDGWQHIYLLDLSSGKLHQVTSGQYDDASISGIDEANRLVYFQSAEASPLRREICVTGLDGTGRKKLSVMEGTNDAEFSADFSFFVNTWSDANTPYLVTVHRSGGELVRVLEDNKRLKSVLAEYKPTRKEFFSFTTTEGVSLNGYMIKPPDFSKKKKYPVYMTQYSGPASQSVSDSWSFGWENFLAQNGYIVVCVDGRGTGFRGEEFRKMTYLQLGKYETLDQIETARYLGNLPYVDKNRIGIFGWSFGGFMVCSCLTRGNGEFKAGIAVAPVTNWRYYDNIYTERFMRKPQDNPDGYDQNSPISHAENLKGKLLLIHGTADDNVHMQNTLEFAEALVQAGKQFDMHLYTNRNHGIYGGNTRLHLYTKIYDFIKRNL